jgi:hypothetical protein
MMHTCVCVCACVRARARADKSARIYLNATFLSSQRNNHNKNKHCLLTDEGCSFYVLCMFMCMGVGWYSTVYSALLM